jgi:hypothetical protein
MGSNDMSVLRGRIQLIRVGIGGVLCNLWLRIEEGIRLGFYKVNIYSGGR